MSNKLPSPTKDGSDVDGGDGGKVRECKGLWIGVKQDNARNAVFVYGVGA